MMDANNYEWVEGITDPILPEADVQALAGDNNTDSLIEVHQPLAVIRLLAKEVAMYRYGRDMDNAVGNEAFRLLVQCAANGISCPQTRFEVDEFLEGCK